MLYFSIAHYGAVVFLSVQSRRGEKGGLDVNETNEDPDAALYHFLFELEEGIVGEVAPLGRGGDALYICPGPHPTKKS